jgi:hypothetical protein
MDRRDWLTVLLLLLIPIPFISSKCLAALSAKIMGQNLGMTTQDFERGLSIFRKQQIESALLNTVLFCIALAVTYFYVGLEFSRISWLLVVSTMLLTQAAFGQLGWEIQTWGGDSVIEAINKWWFRVLYSFGVIFLFVTMIR